MAKIIAASDMNLVLDTAQVTAAQNDGAIYDAAKKKWDLSKRTWK